MNAPQRYDASLTEPEPASGKTHVRRGDARLQDAVRDAVRDAAQVTGQNAGQMAGRAPSLDERSIFHEPWWLDIATGGRWNSAVVTAGNEVVAEMPYMVHRRGLWSMSTQPPLTRTLGPVIRPSASSPASELRYRTKTVAQLVAQLPRFAYFQQVLDTGIDDVAAFVSSGFKVSVCYTLTFPSTQSEQDIWRQMRPNTRNVIRRAEERMTIMPLSDPDAFVDFYDDNLARRKLDNVYGSALMRSLIREVLQRNAGTVLGAFDGRGELCAAVTLVWDRNTLYYLLSTRTADAHSGCVALLIWHAIQLSRQRNLTFDVDGIASKGALTFLSGFGGTMTQRHIVERSRADFSAARAIYHFASDTLSQPAA